MKQLLLMKFPVIALAFFPLYSWHSKVFCIIFPPQRLHIEYAKELLELVVMVETSELESSIFQYLFGA